MTGASTDLTARQINRTTLLRQSLLARSSDGAVASVGRLAGLQAQYANSPYISLWSRVDAFAIEDLERALDERAVVKATVMRGTLHLVTAADYPAYSVASSVMRIANWRPSADRVGVRTADLHRRLLAFCSEPRTIAEMEADLEAVVPDSALVGKVPSGVRHVAFRMADAHGWLVHVPPSGRWESFAKPRYIDASVWLPERRATDAGGRAAPCGRAVPRRLRAGVGRRHREMGRTATAAAGPGRARCTRRPRPALPRARRARAGRPRRGSAGDRGGACAAAVPRALG